MATILKRFTKGIVLRGETSDNAENVNGSLFYNSSDDRIKTYVENAVRQVVTNSQSQVLTNKTIVTYGVGNVLTTQASGNLAATELNAALAELQGDIDTRALNSTLSSHTGASSGVHGVTGSVVGTNDSQALTNKTIVAASNTITTAASGNLAAIELNAALAELQGDIDTRALSVGGSIQSPVRLDVKKDTKANLVTYAATASNGQLCFATDSKEMFQVVDGALVSVGSSGASNVDALLTQTFDQNTLSDFTQTGLALVSTNPMNGAQSARLIHQAVTTQSFKYVKAVDPKYRGKNLTMSFQVRSSATAGNVTLNVYDETNAANLILSQAITLGSSTITATTNSNTTLSGISSSDINKIKVGETITGSGIPTGTTITAISISALTATISQAATASATVTLKNSDLPQKQSASFDVPNNCASISYTISALAESGLPETYVDDVVIQLTSAALTSTSVTVPVNNNTEWASYTPTFTGFGTPTGVSFFWRREGADVLIRGQFVSGTSTAVEGRVSLPSGLVSSSSITTLEYAGHLVYNGTGSATFEVLSEPSVSYVTFGFQAATNAGFVKRTGSQLFASGQGGSFFARIPIQGWSANETTSKTIPLTSAVFATQPDSQMTWQGLAGLGSTRTKIPYFTNPRNMVGSAISWTSNSTNGLEVTVQEDGYYDIQLNGTGDTSNSTTLGLGLNLIDFTTDPSTRTTDSTVLKTTASNNTSTTRDSTAIAWSGPLKAGDKIYPMLGVAFSVYPALLYFSISKVGSTKQINISSDQKIDLPSSELRMGAYTGCASTNTRVAKYGSVEKLVGDAFTIVNDPALGFSLTMKKSGFLNLSTLVSAAAGNYLSISRNATQFSTEPYAMTVGQNIMGGYNSDSVPMAWSGKCNVGDVFRVHVAAAAAAYVNGPNLGSGFNALFQEDKVQVSLSNVLPQFTQSDSSVRLYGAQTTGYSATTKVVRFANVADNFGSDILYTDSASSGIGATFTALSDGIYSISYSNYNATGAPVAIVKNNLGTSNVGTLNDSSVLAKGAPNAANGSFCSWQGSLVKGDVIRCLSERGDDTQEFFTMSKVGKPNLTSVDVTPFTNYKGTDTDVIMLSGGNSFGSTGTKIRRFSVADKNTNLGVVKYVDDSINGAYFQVLKNCYIDASWTDYASGANNCFFGFTLNSTQISTAITAITDGYVLCSDVMDGPANTNSPAQIGFSGRFSVGDIIRPHCGVNLPLANGTYGGTLKTSLQIKAVAEADQIVSPISSFSSDTASLVYAPSTSYTLSTLANAPVGTFITFTASAGANTQTQTTTAPTQSVSDMNVNGIQITGRGFNQTSTAAAPAIVAIQIGKGFKGVQVNGYRTTSKTGVVSLDNQLVSSTINTGLSLKDYNENTGVLIIDAAYDRLGSTNNRYFINDDFTNVTLSTAYLVINASKSPTLAAVPQLQPRIAVLRDEKASGTQGGTFTSGAWQTRTLNTIEDSSGIVTSLVSNQFILPAGEYFIEAIAPADAVENHKCKIRNITDSTDAIIGTSGDTTAGTGFITHSFCSGRLILSTAKTFELQHRCNSTLATSGFGEASSYGVNEVYSVVKIQKIK